MRKWVIVDDPDDDGSKTRVIMTEESRFIRADGAAPVSGRTHSSLIDTGVVKSANWNLGKAARS